LDDCGRGSRPGWLTFRFAFPHRFSADILSNVHIHTLTRTLLLVLLFAFPAGARAQTYETVGTRAQGMAGAFVAVADDATATWWNPAGLASGAYLSAVIERSTLREPATIPSVGPADETRVSGFSLAFPALGLSYYRFRISEIAPFPPTAAVAAGRQDQGALSAGCGVQGAGCVSLRSLALSQFGASVGQSLGDHLVAGSTLKVLRGGSVARVEAAAGADSLQDANDLDVSSETHADLDLGAMARFGHARLALAVKHVAKPTFGSGDTRVELARQARAGAAVSGRSPGIVNSLTLAFDVDLTKTATAVGDVRHVAVGGEAGVLEGRVAVRGGIAKNTVAGGLTSASAGGSIGLRSGLFIDGALTRGSDASAKGWAAALRVTF
jgi:hypothetical protein